jgi:hypothetical protein
MTDRVAAVRTIAIRKRHVTPVLTGGAYGRAAAKLPRGFGARSIEGFLLPAGRTAYYVRIGTTNRHFFTADDVAKAAEYGYGC